MIKTEWLTDKWWTLMAWTKIKKKVNFGCGCSRSFDDRNICELFLKVIYVDLDGQRFLLTKKILDHIS
jgi:hypothetical protein